MRATHKSGLYPLKFFNFIFIPIEHVKCEVSTFFEQIVVPGFVFLMIPQIYYALTTIIILSANPEQNEYHRNPHVG